MGIRGDNGSSKHPFWIFICEFLTLVANAEVTRPVATALAAGALTALNKVPPEQQVPSKPSLRPVNSGTMFLKAALDCVYRHKRVQNLLSKFQKINLGLGVRHGIHKVIHSLRALYEQDWDFAKTDISNAFNEMLRSEMFAEINKHAPWLNHIATAYYGPASPCFYTVKGRVFIILSEEGARMGCVFGSLFFVITIHEHFVLTLQFARSKGLVILGFAIIDDFNLAIFFFF